MGERYFSRYVSEEETDYKVLQDKYATLLQKCTNLEITNSKKQSTNDLLRDEVERLQISNDVLRKEIERINKLLKTSKLKEEVAKNNLQHLTDQIAQKEKEENEKKQKSKIEFEQLRDKIIKNDEKINASIQQLCSSMSLSALDTKIQQLCLSMSHSEFDTKNQQLCMSHLILKSNNQLNDNLKDDDKNKKRSRCENDDLTDDSFTDEKEIKKIKNDKSIDKYSMDKSMDKCPNINNLFKLFLVNNSEKTYLNYLITFLSKIILTFFIYHLHEKNIANIHEHRSKKNRLNSMKYIINNIDVKILSKNISYFEFDNFCKIEKNNMNKYIFSISLNLTDFQNLHDEIKPYVDELINLNNNMKYGFNDIELYYQKSCRSSGYLDCSNLLNNILKISTDLINERIHDYIINDSNINITNDDINNVKFELVNINRSYNYNTLFYSHEFLKINAYYYDTENKKIYIKHI